MAEQLAVFIDFENVARWAEDVFLDFEITPVMEYLQSRGPVITKRAYADWGRFPHYRDELMENAIDLIQMYSVRAGKNRADIRMAVDALEVAMNRPHIHTFVIISGDSDFGALISKLREYGKYTLGIGPRNITHRLLVKSCDEFIYLETLLGETPASEQSNTDQEAARTLLNKALQAHGQRGEVPVLASKLKQTMLSMDSTFNEANFGFSQFKSWLEANAEFLDLYVKDLQFYVAPKGFAAQSDLGMDRHTVITRLDEDLPSGEQPLEQQYRHIFTRLKMTSADFSTRRDVLRDIYREIHEKPGVYTTDTLLEELRERYEAQGLSRSKTTLRHIWQMGFRQRAFAYGDQMASVRVPVSLADGIESEADFVQRAEAGFVYAVVHAGLEIDPAELAAVLVNDRDQIDYIHKLLDDLESRHLVTREGGRPRLAGRTGIPFRDDFSLQRLTRDIEQVQLPDNLPRGAETAQMLAKRAMIQRSQDFSASARSYLLACRLQWDAVEDNEPGATLEDLRWYMASYASVRAGELSQVERNYAGSRPYYLAFFALVQEDDPLWGRMRGLMNPMLSYYWANAGREVGINMSEWNLSSASPAQVAVLVVTHENDELRARWEERTRALAQVNGNVLRRVVEQIRHNYGDQPPYLAVADRIMALMAEQ